MNGSTLTLGLVAGLAVLGAARRGSAASSETEARAAAVAEEEARLDGEVRTRQAKLDAARRKPITDDPDWEEWLAHLAARVEEAKADAARYRAMQRERAAGEAARGLDRSFALQSAEALVDAIRAAGGPSQLRVWTKPGLGVRVYFPGEIGHLTVGEDGSISEASRGKVHFLESGLYPAWRKAVREGRRMYMQQLGARLEAAGEARAARVAEVRKGSAMVFTPAELDSQIAQLQRGIARRKREIAGMEPRAGWGPGYARALSEKREALAYHERELETIRAQRAEWGKGSAARTKCGATFQSYVPPEEEGGLEWLHNRVEASKEKGRNRWGVPSMGRVTGSFTEAVSVPVEVLAKIPGQRNEQDNVRGASLDYIRANWAKVIAFPPYIEVAYNGEAWVSEGNHRIMVAVERGEKTLPVEIRYFDGGERVKGPLHPQRLCSQSLPVSSRVRSAPVPARGSRALDFDFFEDEPEPEASPETRARRAFEAAAGALPETIDASDLFRAWPEGVDERVLIVQRYVRGAVPGWFVYAPAARTEAEAQRLGARLHNALVAPRSLRADQIRLHELPLTVGWPGGTVGVGAER